MTTQRTLKAGDIVTIGKSPTFKLVTRAERKVSNDSMRGDSYWVDEITVVHFDEHQMQRRPYSGAYFDGDREKCFYFDDGCMSGTGKRIKKEDVKVVGTSKLATQTKVTHIMNSVKFYDEG